MLWGRRSITSTGPTPLILVSGFNNLRKGRQWPDNQELVRALLAHGARVNVTDEWEYTPLLYALYARKSNTARLLIEHGATVTGMSPSPNGQSLLSTALLYHHDPTIAKLMVERGADTNFSERTGQTPFGWAVYYGETATVRCMLQYGARPNEVSSFDRKTTPLEYAERHHMTEIAKFLRDAGARR